MLGADEARAEGGREHELELRLERETAVLLDRLESQAQEVARLELELAQAREISTGRQSRIEHLEAGLNELTLQLARAQEAQRQILTSVSWRLTRPLRSAKRAAARS